MNPLVKIDYLRCPATGEPLEWLNDARLAAVQEAIDKEAIVNRGGDLVTKKPEQMLVSQPSGLGYSVLDGIPMLLPDEAIAMCQIEPVEQETEEQQEDEE